MNRSDTRQKRGSEEVLSSRVMGLIMMMMMIMIIIIIMMKGVHHPQQFFIRGHRLFASYREVFNEMARP